MEDNSFTFNSKIKLAKQMLFVLLFVVVGDIAIGLGLKQLFFSQKSGADYKTNYAITKVNSDLVIFGSSRAYRHYNPLIFEKELGLTAFNAGRFGQSIFYSYALQQMIFRRHIPKMILLDIDPNELLFNQTHYERTACLLPYYREYKEVCTIINDIRGDKEIVKNLSSIYPYNSTAIFSIRNRLIDDDPKFKEMKGYKPYKKILSKEKYKNQLQSTIKFDRLSQQEIDPQKVSYFKKFISSAKQHDIQIYIAISPMLYKISNKQSYNTIIKVCQEMEISLLDYYYDEQFFSFENFYDLNHLNVNSSKVFSEKVVHQIKFLD